MSPYAVEDSADQRPWPYSGLSLQDHVFTEARPTVLCIFDEGITRDTETRKIRNIRNQNTDFSITRQSEENSISPQRVTQSASLA